MEEFNSDSGKSTFLIEGHLDGELRKRLASRQMKNHRLYFDGYKLDNIKLAANITCREDIIDLIEFLRITEFCMPFSNGSYQKPSK
jgi:hypothetical protein